MVPQTVGPWMVGRAIDTGIVAGNSAETARWVAAARRSSPSSGAASGIAFHTVIVREWLIALYGTTKLVTRKALQLGHVLTRRTPTGEVLSVSGSDGDQFGALMEVTTRAVSQLAAYLVVAGHRADAPRCGWACSCSSRRRCSCCSARPCCVRCSGGRASSAGATRS